MNRSLVAVVIASCVVPSLANEAGDIHRALKEPTYESTPKYSILALGKTTVWMVEDGKRLFVDKNANGDLTDDGPPILPSDVKNFGTNQWDFSYVLGAITPADGSRHLQFDLRRWNYGEKEDSYGLSLSVDGSIPMYAGWFGTFWSTNRETAPVIPFGGAFSPVMLRMKSFTIGSKAERLSLGFFNSTFGPGAESRLSIGALLPHVKPLVHIEWPTATGAAPLRTSHQLTERCCYWEFYTTAFAMPDGIAPGKARVSVELPPNTMPVELATTTFEVPVKRPSP